MVHKPLIIKILTPLCYWNCPNCLPICQSTLLSTFTLLTHKQYIHQKEFTWRSQGLRQVSFPFACLNLFFQTSFSTQENIWIVQLFRLGLCLQTNKLNSYGLVCHWKQTSNNCGKLHCYKTLVIPAITLTFYFIKVPDSNQKRGQSNDQDVLWVLCIMYCDVTPSLWWGISCLLGVHTAQ